MAKIKLIIGSEAFKERYGVRSWIPVKGKLQYRIDRINQLKADLSPFMVSAIKDCGVIAHGAVLDKSFYPSSVFAPSSCEAEAQIVQLTCNDGVISYSEDVSSLVESASDCTFVDVKPSVSFVNSDSEATLGQVIEVAIEKSASTDTRTIDSVVWTVNGNEYSSGLDSIQLHAENLNDFSISVTVTDSAGLSASSELIVGVSPAVEREFSDLMLQIFQWLTKMM